MPPQPYNSQTIYASQHPIIPELFLQKCQPIVLQNYAGTLGSSLIEFKFTQLA